MDRLGRIYIHGEAFSAARISRGWTAKQLVAAYAEVYNKIPFAEKKDYKNITQSDISRIQTSPLGGFHSLQKIGTVGLLSDILNIAISDIIFNPLIEPKAKKVRLTLRTDQSSSMQPAGTFNDTMSPGWTADMPFVDLPFVPIKAYGSFIEMSCCQADYGGEELIRYILPLRQPEQYVLNQSKVFEISGTSMEPEVKSGERVIADLVPEGRWELLVNKLVVVSYDDMLTIKRIKENELLSQSVLTLHPNHPDLAPLTIRRELIRCIYVVKESFDRKVWD